MDEPKRERLDDVLRLLGAGGHHALTGSPEGQRSFAFQFVYRGLLAGEKCAIVSDTSPSELIRAAASQDISLQEFARSKQLFVIHYSASALAPRATGESRVAELVSLLGALGIARVALDPAAPFAEAGQFARLTRALDGLAATALLVGLPAEILQMHHSLSRVLVFRKVGAQSGRIAVAAGHKREQAALWFTVSNTGLIVDAPAAEDAASASAQPAPRAASPVPAVPRVLIVAADRPLRESLAGQLAPHYAVLQAPTLSVALAQAAESSLVCVGEVPDSGSADAVRRIRKQFDGPVVAIGEGLRRFRDEIDVLTAGADLLLRFPADRLLILWHISRLLSAPGFAAPAAAPPPGDSEAKPRWTTSAEAFRSRVWEEITYSRQNGFLFVVAAIQLADGARDAAGAAAGPRSRNDWLANIGTLTSVISRPRDFIFIGERGAAALLVECSSATSFAARVAQLWSFADEVTIDALTFMGEEDFLEQMTAFLSESIGSRLAEVKPITAAAVRRR